jgi:hypothetical protein
MASSTGFIMNQEESNFDKFERYVMNNIRIRLIRLSDMKFVVRSDVKKHFRSSVLIEDNLYHPFESVRYVILSHRWLDEGEPTYDDMKADTAEGLAGYAKLKNFCEKARLQRVRDGICVVRHLLYRQKQQYRFVSCFTDVARNNVWRLSVRSGLLLPLLFYHNLGCQHGRSGHCCASIITTIPVVVSPAQL